MSLAGCGEIIAETPGQQAQQKIIDGRTEGRRYIGSLRVQERLALHRCPCDPQDPPLVAILARSSLVCCERSSWRMWFPIASKILMTLCNLGNSDGLVS